MHNGETQAAVAEEVNDRLERAVADIANKYAAGKGGVETSESAPTGSAYKADDAARAKMAAKSRRLAAEEAAAGDDRAEDRENRLEQEINDAGDGDGDEDVALRELRESRLRQLKQMQREKMENIGKGHGQYREISQDEFLAEVTSSEKVVCHFYHRDAPICEIMHHHISRLVARHIETKFIKIDAAKAPFFVTKLHIRTMPTLVIFFDGVAVDKVVGFEGLADDQPEGKEDQWPTIKLARRLGDIKAINPAAIVDDDGVEAALKAKAEEMRKTIFAGMRNQPITLDDDEDDFALED